MPNQLIPEDVMFDPDNKGYPRAFSSFNDLEKWKKFAGEGGVTLLSMYIKSNNGKKEKATLDEYVTKLVQEFQPGAITDKERLSVTWLSQVRVVFINICLKPIPKLPRDWGNLA